MFLVAVEFPIMAQDVHSDLVVTKNSLCASATTMLICITRLYGVLYPIPLILLHNSISLALFFSWNKFIAF